MLSTDFLNLNDHPIFKNVRETLPKNIKKTQNIICINDDVLYAWNFQDNCILTLNVKAARNEDIQGVIHQTLLPQSPPLFTPHTLIVNEPNTLVAVIGSKGVLVIELPERCPPYGAFGSNKELIYCRSFSLHERILAFSDHIEVRQAKFHPGSVKRSHILILTSDNMLRLYKLENGVETAIGTYPVGIQPMGRFPKTKTPILEALGETAVDFDYGPPEIKNKKEERPVKPVDDNTVVEQIRELSLTYTTSANVSTQTSSIDKGGSGDLSANFENLRIKSAGRTSVTLEWPVCVLYGNGDVFVTVIELEWKAPAVVKGPLPMLPDYDDYYGKDSCSIICLHSTPPIICIANCKGNIHHAILMPLEENHEFEPDENHLPFLENPDKALYMFESIELELGLTTTSTDVEYNCPILLHTNFAKLGHYFATHETGLHSINITCIEDIHKFVGNEIDVPEPDLFDQPSTVEYLICTKVATSEKVNPVIGFTMYYDPPSILSLLANGQLVTLTLTTLFTIPTPDSLQVQDTGVAVSPLKKMLSEPFDVIIEKILKQSTTQPILKLPAGTEHSQQECYELLQRATQVFREDHFKNHNKAREEIEKRLKALTKLKELQKKDMERLSKERQILQEKAENLAEKYEDTKDKQEEISKRCQQLLILVAKQRAEPSHAEQDFLKQLKDGESRIETYKKAITKIKNTIKYQELQMKNWHQQSEKENVLGSVQADAIKTNLRDMTQKISGMIAEVNQCKEKLNLK